MAGRELFNQTLIESPNQPDDNDRVAFGTPSSATGKNILWGYFKTLIQSIASVFNWIDFTPQQSAPTEQKGRIYYDELTESYEAFEWITGVAPMSLGRTLRSRIKTPVGTPLSKGDIVKITGLDGFTPIVSKAIATELIDARSTIGMVLSDIVADTEANSYGLIAVYDVVLGVNTAGMSVDDLVYLSDTTPGGFTNVAPSPPNYTLPIGFVSVVDAVNGAIGVRFGGFNGNDTSTNSQGIINGIITQTPNVDVSVSGGIIYADVTNEQEPTKNLPFILDGMRYLMDTTTNTGPGGSARVVVPPGADAETLEESIIYLYLNGGVPAIGIATTPPSIPYAKVCNLMVFNAARTLADGKPDGYRRSNDAINLTNGVNDGAIGLMKDVLTSIREKLGSNWISGQDGTPTVNNTNIKLALSAGVARQFRQQNTPFFDGNLYQIYNNTSNIVTYQSSINLTDITQDANGNSLLANNTYYTIRIFYQLNSNGVGNNVIATRPLGFYATAEQAQSDPLNYAVNMGDPIKEELVYPLYDLIIGRSGAGGATISLIELRDRRSKLAQGGGGGGAQGASLDEKLRVSAADTTTDYLSAKLTEGSNITLTIENPGGNETLRIDSTGSTANNGLTKSVNNIQLGGDLLAQTEIDLKNNSLIFSNQSDYSVGTSGFNGQIYSVNLFNNKYYVTGAFTTYDGITVNRVAVFDLDGNLDTNFHTGNTGFNDYVEDSELLPNGSIVFVGAFTSYNGTTSNRIVAVDTGGTIDTSFVIGTGFNATANSIEKQSDNKLIVGGGFTTYNSVASTRLIRINIDGTKDLSYSASTFSGTPDKLRILTDDSLVFLAQNLERFDSTGTRVVGWSGTSLVGNLQAVEFAAGKIYLAGSISQYGVDSIDYVARINLDGTLDTTYNPSGNTWTGTEVTDLKIVANSNLMVVGPFTNYGGVSVSEVARLDLNGELLDMEDITTGFNAYPEKMAVSSTNLFCVGNATAYNGVTINNLCTITTTGLLLQGVVQQIMDFTPTKGYSYKLNGSEIASLERDGTGVFQNVVVNGTLRVPTLIQSETLQVSDNLIVTRYNATVGLAGGEYTGIKATLYDGVNDGQLVFDNEGWARVGDVGNLKKLGAIEETPTDGYIGYWVNANNNIAFKQLTAADITDFNTEVSNNTAVAANTAKVSSQWTNVTGGISYTSGRVGIRNTATIADLEVFALGVSPLFLKNNAGDTRLATSLTNDDMDVFLYDRNDILQVALRSEGDSYFGQGNLGVNKAPLLGTLDVDGTGVFSSTVRATDFTATSLPVYANNAAALSGGLTAGQFYKTAATGDAQVMVVNAT